MNHPHVSQIIDAITYVNQFRGKTFLIKLGGSILEENGNLEQICLDLKLLTQAGIHVVIVHGGSKAINQTLQAHGVETTFLDGLRVTSFEAVHLIEMVLCGHVNKQLVRQLNHIGLHATGLSGSDNNMLLCDPYSQEHGYVGMIKSVNVLPILSLLKEQSSVSSVIPVIAPMGVNQQGNPMNINADYAACQLAIALNVDKLIYLTDQAGIYDKQGCLISDVSLDELETLIINHTVQGGMLVKCKAIIAALKSHLNHVHILNGNHKHVLLEELFTAKGVGTLCHSQISHMLEVAL
ncbi:acetylglutamate kinase [Legionella sp. W05-934-2]|jgi:acetylglutamate kinase|uniref:acetylglutamate kinase n=1 Tax=Legionella sp. W05-934-2 TaxID=1198649 RepID=UPI00346362E1